MPLAKGLRRANIRKIYVCFGGHRERGTDDAGDIPKATFSRAEPLGRPIIREQLARRRISRRQLVAQAKISISTLEEALSGRRPFTFATTVRLEEALGVSLRKGGGEEIGAAPANLAPGHLGFQARPAVTWIEGSYLTPRPSFSDPQAIFAYRTEIIWDDGLSSLTFWESERVDAEFSQQGLVSVPHNAR